MVVPGKNDRIRKLERGKSRYYMERTVLEGSPTYSVVSIKRTGSLNYLEFFYHPELFFYVLNDFFYHPDLSSMY